MSAVAETGTQESIQHQDTSEGAVLDAPATEGVATVPPDVAGTRLARKIKKNDNRMAYIGCAAIVAFICLMLSLFIPGSGPLTCRCKGSGTCCVGGTSSINSLCGTGKCLICI
jgi:hypothetical protein